MKKIFSVGYQKSANPSQNFQWHEFVEILTGQNINRLIDIRRYNNYPKMATNPWCMETMKPALEKKGLIYQSEKKLAPTQRLLGQEKRGDRPVDCKCRSEVACFKENTHPRIPITLAEFNRRYLEEMNQVDGITSCYNIIQQYKDENVCFMCYETDFTQCHRKTLLDALLQIYPGQFERIDLNILY